VVTRDEVGPGQGASLPGGGACAGSRARPSPGHLLRLRPTGREGSSGRLEGAWTAFAGARGFVSLGDGKRLLARCSTPTSAAAPGPTWPVGRRTARAAAEGSLEAELCPSSAAPRLAESSSARHQAERRPRAVADTFTDQLMRQTIGAPADLVGLTLGPPSGRRLSEPPCLERRARTRWGRARTPFIVGFSAHACCLAAMPSRLHGSGVMLAPCSAYCRLRGVADAVPGVRGPDLLRRGGSTRALRGLVAGGGGRARASASGSRPSFDLGAALLVLACAVSSAEPRLVRGGFREPRASAGRGGGGVGGGGGGGGGGVGGVGGGGGGGCPPPRRPARSRARGVRGAARRLLLEYRPSSLSRGPDRLVGSGLGAFPPFRDLPT
jgi:hypothetical protein